MSRPIMILFMVSVDTHLNKNLLLIFNFFKFFTLVKANFFLVMELILSFPNDIEVSSGQLKRFDKPVFDPKCFIEN